MTTLNQSSRHGRRESEAPVVAGATRRAPLPYILVINSLMGGGAERQASLLSSHLPPAAICTLEPGVVYDTGDVPIVCLGSAYRDTSVARLLEVPVFARRLARHGQPVVVSFLERSNFVNLLSKRFFPHAAVISERSYPSRYYGKGLKRAQLSLIRWSYPHAELVVTNAHGTAEDLVNRLQVPEDRIRVVPNMLDLPGIQAQRAQALPPEHERWFDVPVVVTVGRFKAVKGTQHLIRAFAEVRRRVRARLLLLGDGPLRPYLQALVEGLGLSQDVSFAGFVDRPWSYVARSTVFALTSLSEGFPNALIEAMACGVAAVSTDCPAGPREILDGPDRLDQQARGVVFARHGVLVPVPSGRKIGPAASLEPAERCLADAVTTLMSDSVLRAEYARAGRARVEMFHPARVVPLWREIIATAAC